MGIESALARRVREGLTAEDEAVARSRLGLLADRWSEVAAVDLVRRQALRLLRSHPLGAAAALQLAAALVCCDERPEQVGFVCLDDCLSEAARREGFAVLP